MACFRCRFLHHAVLIPGQNDHLRPARGFFDKQREIYGILVIDIEGRVCEPSYTEYLR